MQLRRQAGDRADASRARVTFGKTVDEAIAMAREAIEIYLEDLQETGEEVPTGEGALEYTLNVEVRASYLDCWMPAFLTPRRAPSRSPPPPRRPRR